MIIFAVDPGEKNAAWAVLEGETVTQIGEARGDNWLRTAESLVDALDEWRPDVVAAERYVPHGGSSVIGVAHCVGAVLFWARQTQHQARLLEVAPVKWMEWAKKKQLAIALHGETPPPKWDAKNEHIRDAVRLAYYVLAMLAEEEKHV